MGERWDRDRFMFERSRDQQSSRGGDDDRYSMRGGRGGRDFSADNRRDRRSNRAFDDDDMVRDRRYYDDDFRPPRRERESDPDFRRAPVMEKERDSMSRRDSPPPRRRPGFLRRQSSLDTFDRPPHPIFHEREEYPPPARREDIRRDDFRLPPYKPIPLPKTKALPPPRGFEREFYAEEEFSPYPPERLREREVVKSRRGRSRDSFRSRSVRSSSVSSSSSSHSSSSSGGTTVKSEYPKKGKTRIPAKLVSRQALIDLSYPFYEEGNTIIVLKALGQDNIDELLKVSEEYKKFERPDKVPAALPAPESKAPPSESSAPASAPKAPADSPPAQAPPAATIEVKIPAPPAPEPEQRAPPPMTQAPPPPPVVFATPPPPRPAPAPAPVIIQPQPPPSETTVSDWVEDTYYREVSPTRSTTTTSSWDTQYHHHHHRTHRREKSAPIAMGPVAVVDRSRSRSRGGKELRAEIRALERELAHRPRGGYEGGRELVRAERLPDGQLVVYEEEVEDVVEHHKPPRIEKDKKGPPPRLMRAMLATLT